MIWLWVVGVIALMFAIALFIARAFFSDIDNDIDNDIDGE